MSLDESYLNSLDDQPKDLTVKTAKKMKPIPPPLNLTPEEIEKMPLSMLKEFAMIATSPKSPLMQKHLPFRKRAHSIPVNPAKQETGVIIPPTVEENCASVCKSHSIPTSPSVVMAAHRSHTEPISNPDLTRDSYVLDLSTNPSSVLLSPTPSSLGSSREELADSAKHLKFMSWNFPWPPPVWHCFQSGIKVKAGGCWRPVEEMTTYLGELMVERISLSPPHQVICCTLSSYGEVVVDLTPCHPLLVKERGWVAICPDSFHMGDSLLGCTSLSNC